MKVTGLNIISNKDNMSTKEMFASIYSLHFTLYNLESNIRLKIVKCKL